MVWKTEDETVGKVGCFPFRSHFLLLPVCPVGKPAGLEALVPFLPESTQTSLARGELWAEARLSVALTSLPPVLSHSQGPPMVVHAGTALIRGTFHESLICDYVWVFVGSGFMGTLEDSGQSLHNR